MLRRFRQGATVSSRTSTTGSLAEPGLFSRCRRPIHIAESVVRRVALGYGNFAFREAELCEDRISIGNTSCSVFNGFCAYCVWFEVLYEANEPSSACSSNVVPSIETSTRPKSSKNKLNLSQIVRNADR